jgi:cell wall assembly regulator SMI1
LHACIDNKNIGGIKLLLSRGADTAIPGPERGSKPASTALEYAKKKKVKKAIEILEGSDQPAKAPIVDLQAVLDKLIKEKSYSWFPPATEEEIAELAAFVGEPLSRALLDLYRRANGQDPDASKPLYQADSLDNGWYLSPISEVIADGKMLTKILDNGNFAGQKKQVVPDEEVRKEWWDRHWLPILANGGGDHICLDFNPSPSGKVGQAIKFWHDSGERKLLSECLDELIGDLDSQ